MEQLEQPEQPKNQKNQILAKCLSDFLFDTGQEERVCFKCMNLGCIGIKAQDWGFESESRR